VSLETDAALYQDGVRGGGTSVQPSAPKKSQLAYVVRGQYHIRGRAQRPDDGRSQILDFMNVRGDGTT
jgi:hypothetical protein